MLDKESLHIGRGDREAREVERYRDRKDQGAGVRRGTDRHGTRRADPQNEPADRAGDEDRQDYFHTTLGHMTMHKLGEAPDALKGGEVKLGMPWEADALQSLMTIPPRVRKMVTEQTEAYCREKGEGKVSQVRMDEFAREQGMTPEFMERFRKKQRTA